MRLRVCLALTLCALVLGPGCEKKPERATREAVLPLLQKEAASLKTDGEKVNPSFGVKSTWNIRSVDVREQPDSATQPWRGTIKIQIDSQMQDADGTVTNDRLDKSFEYAYDQASGQWRMQASPGR